ncbi:hypothetical protein [Actinocrispum wychmicini]|uniref:Uncharacterized protein n=1 Tax=Actinocrispum wychmicini TaxID=1213861 RepID=A0A4R2J277_9PSEU|nr:hypothetical protein [Actinocrispum wychmicini]TCO52293.1 hypothetical protein EV192_11224 [Actinocrispum wychmicini]
MKLLLRFAAAICLAVSGYIHADLYAHGYRVIPVVGPSFLWLAAASFAVAILVAAGAPLLMQVVAGALAVGALGGFLLSRTVGIFGFIEQGWQPAPEAAISVAVEIAVVILVGVPVLQWIRQWLANRGSVRSSAKISAD